MTALDGWVEISEGKRRGGGLGKPEQDFRLLLRGMGEEGKGRGKGRGNGKASRKAGASRHVYYLLLVRSIERKINQV